MTNYPGAIDEFRVTQNIPGVLYNADDTKTVFAEDTNNHSDAIVAIETTLGANPQGDYETVADRLAAGGGGGGAWEYVDGALATGSETELNINGLDLQADEAYLVFFSVQCNSAECYLDWYGSSIITQSWSGLYSSGGSVTGTTSRGFLSHRSLGPGIGSMLIQTTPNGTASATTSYVIGNYRLIQAGIIDGLWYNGGLNLTRLRLNSNPTASLVAGSRISVYKRKV